jgi:hypothetical protein
LKDCREIIELFKAMEIGAVRRDGGFGDRSGYGGVFDAGAEAFDKGGHHRAHGGGVDIGATGGVFLFLVV